MGEAKRRLQGGGPVHLQPIVEIDVAIEDFERCVEAGLIRGMMQIGLVASPAGDVVQLWTFGVDKQRAYDMLCVMKRSFEDTMGFREVVP